jgi:thymidylate kinase
MIIILEGPDGVGKTTVANALAFVCESPVMVRSGPPDTDNPLKEYWGRIDELEDLSSLGHTVIVDRFHVGELVYGNLLRETTFTRHEASAVTARLMSLRAVLVHCDLDRTEMTRRLMARDGGKPDEKSGATMGHSLAIRAAYKYLIGKTSALGGYWFQAAMSEYPEQTARSILALANVNGVTVQQDYDRWVGTQLAPTILAVQFDVMAHPERLAWMLKGAAECGFTARTVAFVTVDHERSWPACVRGNVIAIGDRVADKLNSMNVQYDRGPVFRRNEMDVSEPGLWWRLGVMGAVGS